MSIITKINGIPLFQDEKRARLWGAHYGLTGSHTHVYNGITGFMAGSSHEQSIDGVIKSGKAPAEVIREYNRRNQQVAVPRSVTARVAQQPTVRVPTQPMQPTPPMQPQPRVFVRRTVSTPPPSTGGSSGGGSGGGGGGY